MPRIQVAECVLAAAILAAVPGCAAPGQPAPTPAATTSAPPPAETLTPLLAQALPNAPGKTFTSAVVDFPPGARAVPHRHGDAFVYAYVLDGSVSSTVDGEPARTYRQGEDWVEQPGAHHVATENTSQTEGAKLLVVFVSTTGDPLKVDDPASG